MTPQRLNQLGLQRLDLLCGFMHHELGENSLVHAPVLLMGYQSVTGSTLLKSKQIALENLRRCCSGLGTLAALRAAAGRYNDFASFTAEGKGFRFEINEKTLEFSPIFDLISDPLQTALRELYLPAAPIAHDLSSAVPDREMCVSISFDGETRRYPIKGLPQNLQPPPKHAERKRRRTALTIAWADLIKEAEQMDAIDQEMKRSRPGNWAKRMRATNLMSPSEAGTLVSEPSITLQGVKHLIGVPGAGKTTLLVCLLRYLGVRGIKTAVFFPSIEVCRQYLDDLRRYDVAAGLLVGQSQKSKQTHAFKLAESLATHDPLRGFGSTVTSTPLFEGVCALPCLTSAPANAFSVEDHFCRSILQSKSSDGTTKSRKGSEPHLCPVWTLCSRNKASRELPDMVIWLGHIRSADTHVPPHTTTYNERYFDLIARNFDVVIFDEADSAQQALDMSGIAQLKLSGYRSSFHHDIQDASLRVLAIGANARLRDESFVQFSLECAEFEKLNISLISAIHRLDERHRNALSGLLLTPLRLIGDWLTPKHDGSLSPLSGRMDMQARAKEALSYIWEDAAIAAFQSRREIATESPRRDSRRWRRVAETLKRTLASVDEDANRLRLELTAWLNTTSLRDRNAQEDTIEEILSPYVQSSDPATRKMLVRLLISVTFTVLSYRRLEFRLEALASDGVILPIRVDERCSAELLMSCPDNLLGSLSGVRFFTDQEVQSKRTNDRDVKLQYIVFSGAPRAFMYRLHQWIAEADGVRSGPAVLLTSATSYFPSSPAFHLAIEPSYLLRRAEPTTSDTPSYYAFRPIPDPDSLEHEPLRYSGVSSERTRLNNLQKMVAGLLDGGPQKARLVTDCATFDVQHGIGRKAAFVVNSYDHSLMLKQFIDQRYPAWRDRTIAVVNKIPSNASLQGYVTSSMVESLGDSADWDILIFPMGALGRGTNVVFSNGPRQRDATIGTLYFLTRPHPSPDDLNFLVSIGAQSTVEFDRRDLTATENLDDFSQELKQARSLLYRNVGHLLRHPLYARSLGKELFTPFTANVAVPLLQTIGRAMRNGCPVQCFFVDRSWAEESSFQREDTEATSMLIQLRRILEKGITSSNLREALLFKELFGSFYSALENISGLYSSNVEQVKNCNKDDGGDINASPLWESNSPVQ
ncbi:ATP-binding protein [Burkholderia sp. LMG 21824]|uniref:ATP-binding protein n=1 Tax=Burkholderia sp. LMG 21824 TaxID=3158172 RepID=UPI003C2CB9BA